MFGIRRFLLTLGVALASIARADAASISSFAIYAQANVVVGGNTVVGTTGQPVLVGAGTTVVGVGDGTVAGGAGIYGDLRAGDDVTLNNNSFVSGTITNPDAFTVGSGVTYGAHVTAMPDLPTLPSGTSFSNGVTDQSVGNGATMNLSPGSYNDISLGGAATLNLTAGNYYLNNLTAGNGLTLNVALGGGNLNLYLTGSFHAGGIQAMNLTGGNWQNVYAEAHGTGVTGAALDNVFQIAGGSGTNWYGTVLTTNGGIHLGSGSSSGTIQGYLWSARNVDLEHSLDVIGVPVPVPAAVWLMASALGLLGWVRSRMA